MVQIVDGSGLKMVSGPFKSRPGLYPMIVALAIGFGFSIAWLTVSVMLIFQGTLSAIMWGVMTALCTLAYCVYMGYMVYRIVEDSQRLYILEVNHSEAVLTVLDKLHHKKSTQMVLLDDVKYAEYYPYTDSCTVILHAPYTVMEIPLWQLGTQSQDVMDFLSGRGIPIVNAQFDDKIPTV